MRNARFSAVVGVLAALCCSAIQARPVPTSSTLTSDGLVSVTLGDGERAVVVWQSVTNIAYLKAILPGVGAGAQPTLVPGLIASGTQLARKADGSCVRIERRLVALEDVQITLGTIQVPLTKVEETPADCQVPTGPALPA